MKRILSIALWVCFLGFPLWAETAAPDHLPPEARAEISAVEPLLEAGRWAEALPGYERALSLTRAKLGPGDAATLDVAVRYGKLLVNSGRSEAALGFFEQLFAETKRHFLPHSFGYLQVEMQYASQLAVAGRTSEALPLAMGAVQRIRGMTGALSTETALFMMDAATILKRMGYLQEAVAAYRGVVPIFDAQTGPVAAKAAAGAVLLQADALERSGQQAAAMNSYRDADTRTAAAFGEGHTETLAVRLARARSAYALELYPELADLVAVNLPVVVEVFGRESIAYAMWLRTNARLLLAQDQGDPQRAIPMMRQAVEMLAGRLPATDFQLAESRRDFAGLLSYGENFDEAWDQLMLAHTVLAPDRKYIFDLLEFRRKQGGLTDDGFAKAALPQLQQVAYGKARGAVREQVMRRLIRDPAIAAEYRDATDMMQERSETEAALVQVASRPLATADRAAEAQLRARHAELTAAIDTRLLKVRTAEPAFAEVSGQVDLDIAALQALLGPEEALVVIDHQRHDEEWSMAVAITRDTAVARVFWVPVADLTGWVQQIRDAVQVRLGVRGAVALDDAEAPELFPFDAAFQLYTNSVGMVWEPLIGKTHVMLDLRGPMTAVPPALLLPVPPEPAMTLDAAPWLIRFHAITVLPSISSLRTSALAADATPAPEGFAGFADPVFDVADADPLLFAQADTGALLRGVLAPLPETADEASAVRDAVADGQGALWLGAEASEATLKAAPLDRYRMLYFATHGLVSGDRAGGTLLSEPALALTPGTGEDGFLTASEIAELRLNADFVVLSACNTAEGDAPGAEPLSGLAQAFLYAGARSLLVSHWPVESRSAVRLMTDTFRIRADTPGIRAAEAQRRAILAMIDNPFDARWSHPAYWAPFVLVGSPD